VERIYLSFLIFKVGVGGGTSLDLA